MRIDHRPLAGPIILYARTPVNMTAFHAICPHHVFVHCRKHALHISSIETVVKTSQMFLLHVRNLAASALLGSCRPALKSLNRGLPWGACLWIEPVLELKLEALE